jgi:outer membrane protein OmpA-like peptidoglycan-associated protein
MQNCNKIFFSIQRLFAFCYLLLFSFNSFSQSQNKLLRTARQHANKGNYYSAEESYLKILKKDSLHLAANMELGLILNEYLANPVKAGTFLFRAEKTLKNNAVPELIYEIGRYYHMTGNFEKAKTYFNQLLKYEITAKEDLVLRTNILKSIADCDYALNNKNKIDPRFTTHNIGANVNSLYPEYVPVITSENNSLIFTSRSKSNRHNKINYTHTKYYNDVFLARISDGKFHDSISFTQNGIESSYKTNAKINQSIISISHEGKNLFFFNKKRTHETDNNGAMWTEPRELAKSINFDFFQNHASISPDGNTIYFTGSSKKGENDFDIYTATKDKDGNWSNAINLGEVINTTFDEDSPFIDIDGKTLYFSSEGREGFGGFDIYKSTFDGTTWSKPINLGMPINSPSDDFDFTLNEVGNKGYFSSCRIGGYGDLDIYSFVYDNCENFADTGTQFTQNEKPFLYESVTFDGSKANVNSEDILSYYWFMNDAFMLKDSKNFTAKFDSIGLYKVKMQIQTKNHNYCYSKAIEIKQTKKQFDSLLVSSNNNLANNLVGNTNNSNSNLTNNIANNNLNTNLNDANVAAAQDFATIYFDFNKASLNSEALVWLNKLVETLKSNPTAAINIASHCDSRGSTTYNEVLSNKRSQSIVQFLLKNGIKRKQIKSIKNMGESNPINACNDNSTCDDTQHAFNRRAQLSLIK